MGLFRKKELSEVEKNFYAEFQPEEQELIILAEDACHGATVRGDFYTPSIRFLASVNPENNELSQEDGVLTWIIPRKPEKKDWGCKFKKLNLYKVRVRKCYEKELAEYQSEIANRRFLVVKVLNHIQSEPRLDAIKEAYLKPVYIDDAALGRFTLERKYNRFDGNIDWLGTELSVQLKVDKDNDSTAKCAFEVFKNVVSDMRSWDERARKYAAEELTGLANDWNEDEEEGESEKITEEDFAKRIDICSIKFHNDGSFEITFNDDDMFFGHWVVVSVDEHGAFNRADMEG